jgi:hypothetical protein
MRERVLSAKMESLTNPHWRVTGRALHKQNYVASVPREPVFPRGLASVALISDKQRRYTMTASVA